MKISQAIVELFGGMFTAPSWRRWKVFLKALEAIPMTEEELEIFRHHTARSIAPLTPSRYGQLVVGRRGGKSRILALIAACMACLLDHSPHLVPGENAVVAIIAADRKQARIILNYVAGLLRSVPMLATMIVDEIAEAITLNNNVIIEIHTGSIAAPRGRTFLCVLADECAFWAINGESANPDVEVINAVRPGLASIPYSLLLIASSPYARRGILYQNYAKYFGHDDAPVLVWQGSTVEMNDTLVDDPLILEMYDEDVERASAEFGAQFRTDIVAFITRDAVEAVIARGVRELPASGAIEYTAFTDPSGGSADSMTLAIGHMETDGTAVLDAVRERKPPFSPDTVVQEFAELLKSYGIARVQGDAYAGEWPRERFSVHGISYDVSERNKSKIYTEFLPALNGQRVRLLDLPRLVGQLVTLERRTARGGRDSVDHAPGASDDVANAVAGVLVQVLADRRPALVRPSDTLVEGAALPVPSKGVRYVVAIVGVDANGTIATVYAGRMLSGFRQSLLILDFDLEPMRAGVFGAIAARIRDLAGQCRTQHAVAYVPEGLARHAAAGGLWAQIIPPELKPEDRLLSAAHHLSSGTIKLCAPAGEKALAAPFSGALDFKAGDLTDDPLRAAAILTIALTLDHERNPQ